MKRLLYIIVLSGLMPLKLSAKKIVIATGASAIVYQVDADAHLQQIYLGKRLLDTSGYRNVNASLNRAFATGGLSILTSLHYRESMQMVTCRSNWFMLALKAGMKARM